MLREKKEKKGNRSQGGLLSMKKKNPPKILKCLPRDPVMAPVYKSTFTDDCASPVAPDGWVWSPAAQAVNWSGHLPPRACPESMSIFYSSSVNFRNFISSTEQFCEQEDLPFTTVSGVRQSLLVRNQHSGPGTWAGPAEKILPGCWLEWRWFFTAAVSPLQEPANPLCFLPTDSVSLIFQFPVDLVGP